MILFGTKTPPKVAEITAALQSTVAQLADCATVHMDEAAKKQAEAERLRAEAEEHRNEAILAESIREKIGALLTP
ncbi:hypothetical protein [Enterovirga aerilata]|uniref:Uncharacterized protein n=1 Tax=Enterovirga aerilata TaxID=2730920 RepID=A0A849IF82_9HYPH|nr:hypothetical protein [Enterovirga sp. DB1703]NNM74780.1 hypothetical protein [Enterovirga sp. DB1703]